MLCRNLWRISFQPFRCVANQTISTNEPPGQMEKTLNQVTLLGRVGSEPQKRGTEKHPVVIFSLATHVNFKYETGEFVQKTDWHRICVFRPALRDTVFTYLKKGQRVYVSGKLTYGSIEEDSIKKTTASVVAEEIIFINSGND